MALKLGLLALDVFPFNADEAVVGLMAGHILEGRWPVFFYGQAYMGSMDASLVAIGFALFGQRVIVIRAVQVLLYLGTVFTTMQLGRRIFRSTQVALIAGLLMAIPVVNVTLYTTVSLGGYGEMLLIGNLLLLLALRIAIRNDENWPYLVWGFLAGLGFWAFGMTLVYILPAAGLIGWTMWRGTTRSLILKRILGAIAGFLIGAGPIEQTIQQSFYVKGCSPNCYDRFFALLYLVYGIVRYFQKGADAERLRWFDYIDQVVFYFLLCLFWWFSGADVHSSVDLHRVDTDYFSIEVFCEVKG